MLQLLIQFYVLWKRPFNKQKVRCAALTIKGGIIIIETVFIRPPHNYFEARLYVQGVLFSGEYLSTVNQLCINHVIATQTDTNTELCFRILQLCWMWQYLFSLHW